MFNVYIQSTHLFWVLFLAKVMPFIQTRQELRVKEGEQKGFYYTIHAEGALPSGCVTVIMRVRLGEQGATEFGKKFRCRINSNF